MMRAATSLGYGTNLLVDRGDVGMVKAWNEFSMLIAGYGSISKRHLDPNQQVKYALNMSRNFDCACGRIGCRRALFYAGRRSTTSGHTTTSRAGDRHMPEVLNHEHLWVKVHAAEYLLWLDYSDGVQETFTKELGRHDSEPQYRIGIWRVLGRAANNNAEQAEWFGKIRDVLVSPNSPDRPHAAETLTKLRYKLRGDEVEVVERIAAKSEDEQMISYLVCLLALADQPGAEARLVKLLESNNDQIRLSAAYAIRHLPTISASAKEKLQAAARSEPRGSPARVYLIGAVAVHSCPNVDPSVKAELAEYAVKGIEDNKVEACQVLAQVADNADLPLLTRLLDNSNSDLRSTAGYAILRVGRRVPHHLAVWDWAVIAAYVLGMLAVGWYFSRKNKTGEDYLLGGRHMRPVMVGVSLFASLISTISYLAYPGEVIKNGPMIVSVVLGYPLVGVVVGWLIIPSIMRLKVTSAYEILEVRLGSAVRTLGSVLFLTLRLLWMSVIVYATASKVLIPLSGLSPDLTPAVCALLAFVTIVYTAMGGLRAVVVTDVIQSAILLGAAIVTVVTITVCLGGVHAWWPSHGYAHWPEPQYGYDPNARVTMFGAMLAMFTWYICTSSSDQIAVQRYLATRDAKAARTVLFISLLADTLVMLVLAAVGLGLLAYFRTYPHLLPDAQTVVGDSDKLFSQFIIIGLPVGLSGLVVAGLLACAMSALSAGINSTCSVITVDVIDRLRGKNRTADSGRVKLLRYVSVVVGVIVVSLSLLVNMMQGNLLEIAFKVVNLLTAPLAGLFFLAMFVPWAKGFGALVGAACGLTVVIVVSYWKEITGTQGISFIWAMPLSLLVEVGVGAVVSLIPIGRRPLAAERDTVGSMTTDHRS